MAWGFSEYSDSRVKTSQVALEYGLNEVMQLQPKKYQHHLSRVVHNGITIDNESFPEIGLIAQDVFTIIPEAVSKPENDNEELWGLNYTKLIPVLINAIQEQQSQIESQKSERSRRIKLKIRCTEWCIYKSLHQHPALCALRLSAYHPRPHNLIPVIPCGKLSGRNTSL
jgi:hypothetical protein